MTSGSTTPDTISSPQTSLYVKSQGRVWVERVLTAISGLCFAIAVVPLVAVLTYVIGEGGSRLSLDLFTELPPAAGLSGGGIANAILGTILIVSIATLISVPFGVSAAVYLAEFSPPKVARGIRFATDVLNGVPSILMGVFAYAILVVTTKTYSAVAGGVALAVLMLPTIIRTTDESLQLIPRDVRWASVGVGASNYQTVLRVILPAALPALTTGVILGIARAAGETAPLVFTSLFSFFWVRFSLDGVWSATPSLAVLVYNFATSPFAAQQELAWAAALVLVSMVLITSILARFATRKQTF